MKKAIKSLTIILCLFVINKTVLAKDILIIDDCLCGPYERKIITETKMFDDMLLKQYENNTNQTEAIFTLTDINNRLKINYNKEELYHHITIKKKECGCIRVNMSTNNTDAVVSKLANTSNDKNNDYNRIEDLILGQFANIESLEQLDAEIPGLKCDNSGGNEEAVVKDNVSTKKQDYILHKLQITDCNSTRVYKDIVYPMVVEESEVPEGYKKSSKYIVLIPGTVSFNISNNNIEKNFTPSSSNSYHNDYYRYDLNYNYSTMYKLTEEELTEFKNEYRVTMDTSETNICHEENYCDNVNGSSVCGKRNVCKLANVIFNEISRIDLKIENYIENTSNISAKKGDKLTYKVNVTNNGTDTSHNNIIKSEIPVELVYVPGSVTNGGIYDAESRTITWNIEKLNSVEQLELKYQVLVNKEIENISSIQLSSSIISDETTEIKSTPVTVTVEEKNSSNVIPIFNSPKTGALLSIIMLLSSLVIVGFLTIKYFKKQQNN